MIANIKATFIQKGNIPVIVDALIDKKFGENRAA